MLAFLSSKHSRIYQDSFYQRFNIPTDNVHAKTVSFPTKGFSQVAIDHDCKPEYIQCHILLWSRSTYYLWCHFLVLDFKINIASEVTSSLKNQNGSNKPLLRDEFAYLTPPHSLNSHNHQVLLWALTRRKNMSIE